MMHRKTQTTLAALLLGATAITAVPTASHALVSVRAPAELAKLAEQVTTAKNQLTELSQMTNLTQQMNDAIGSFGPLGDVFGGAAFSKIGSQADFYTNMEKFAFDPCAINLCTVGDNPVGVTDFDQALEWARKNYFSSVPLDQPSKRDLEEVRRRAVVYASTNGLALANIVHTELAGAGAEADALEQIVESKNDMRGQIRASNAIALASYKVHVQQLAILTAMLEVESTEAMVKTNLIHENGGTEFPDAYIDDDFGLNGHGRSKVTVPRKGSAGGSGFGGGLFGSTLGSNSGLGSLIGGDIGSLLGGSNPLAGLAEGITNGTFPSIDPSDISMPSILGDAMGMSSDVVSSLGNRDIAGALRTVQSGLAAPGGVNGSQVVVGAGQAQAAASNNNSLAGILRVAESALRGDTSQMTNFAEGVVRDLQANGAVSAADYLTQQISGLQSGSGNAETLVLDAAALIANFGADANTQVATTLGTDTNALSDDALRALLALTIDQVAQATGQAEIRAISDGIRNLSEDDIQTLRNAAESARTSTAVSQPRDAGSDTQVFD
jgi:hypothetical protein